MYRLGDYVYFENAPASSYVIRKIEELNRTANGNVEAKVLCFYRRSEVPKTLLVRKSIQMMSPKLHYKSFYFDTKRQLTECHIFITLQSEAIIDLILKA